MPSFRSAANQARTLLARHAAHGTARHNRKTNDQIHSLGTERSYRDALTLTAQWLKTQGHLDGLHRITPTQARDYLQHRATQVSQSTLDRDRQALQLLLGHPLARTLTQTNKTTLSHQPRAYTPAQVEAIAQRQPSGHALATRIAYSAGLRAHELRTLRRYDERPPSTHRSWHPERYRGRDDWIRLHRQRQRRPDP